MNDPWDGLDDKYVIKNQEQIQSPGTKYVFLEEDDPRGFNIGPWVLFPGTTWGDPVVAWHGGRGALSFADNHCELRRWKDARTTLPRREDWSFLGGNNWDNQSDNEDLHWLQIGNVLYQTMPGPFDQFSY